MNIKRISGNSQGKFPKLRKGKDYQQTIAALLMDSAKMAGADPIAVGRVFADSGIKSVLIGGLVVGCHTGRPRLTQDLDVIVDVGELSNSVIAKLGKAVGSKKVEKHPSFISFLKGSRVGDREVLDVITSKAGSYRLVFDNYLALKVGDYELKIPTAEMLVVLKYTAAVNPVRSKAKQAQDWADILAILDANERISTYTISYLADEVVPGWGDDLKIKISQHRNGNAI